MSVRTYDKLTVALDAVRRHQKAHNKIFDAYEDKKLDKIAVFHHRTDIRWELLDDGSPRYVWIGDINSLPALIRASLA